MRAATQLIHSGRLPRFHRIDGNALAVVVVGAFRGCLYGRGYRPELLLAPAASDQHVWRWRVFIGLCAGGFYPRFAAAVGAIAAGAWYSSRYRRCSGALDSGGTAFTRLGVVWSIDRDRRDAVAGLLYRDWWLELGICLARGGGCVAAWRSGAGSIAVLCPGG